MSIRRLAAVLSVVTLLVCAAGARSQVIADPYESSVNLLRQATHTQSDGSHLPLLFALRQLRDPDLKGLFHQLSQRSGESGQWPLQVHAVLGLAEIDPERHIDPWLVTRIAPRAQEAVIASALDTDLLPDPIMAEILKWDQLDPMARLFLLAEQVLKKQPPDVEELKRLSAADDLHTAGLSAALLAQVGEAGPFQAFLSRLSSATEAERTAITQWLMDGARRYKLTALSDWIASCLSKSNIDPDVAYRGTLALLALDPARGMPAWERYLSEQSSFPHRVRCGMILLAARENAPAEAYDRLVPGGEDEQLLACIAEVGKAIAKDSNPADALIALLEVGHPKTSLWVMEYLKTAPAEHTESVYRYLIDRLDRLQPQWTEAVGQAVEATTRLYAIKPDFVLGRLREAEDDSALQQALLLGLFEVNDSKVGSAAAALPRIGSGRADSLALLLMAKHAVELSPEDLKHLGTIASGGGRVSNVLQIQAAWLYLKRSGRVDQAMAAVFAQTE